MDSAIRNYTSPIGNLLISSEGENITAVTFRDIIPEERSSTAIDKCIIELDEYFSGAVTEFKLPLTQPGTPFQQKVWASLEQIPYGATVSYHALSKRLGNVKAIRAVGTANGKNNIAIIIPCHRVIGSNGSLVGYAGELWRKKWLLEHEAKFAHGVQTLFSTA